MNGCVAKALGVGPKWCVPYECKNNSDCTGGAGCSVCWAGLCGINRPSRTLDNEVTT